MTNQNKPKVEFNTQGIKEALLSIVWSVIVGAILLMIEYWSGWFSSSTSFPEIPSQYIIFIAIFIAIITIVPVSIILVMQYYKIQTHQTEKAITRLKEKETDFFNEIEANWIALTKKVQ